MSEFQKCLKCQKVFSQFDRTGPSIGHMGDVKRYANEQVCPSCGGRVLWVDDNEIPLSGLKREEELGKHLGLGCLWSILALIIGYLLFRSLK